MKSSKCIACENCVRTCAIGAISWDHNNDKPIVCIHCGYCTDYCAYDVIQIREKGGAQA